MHTTSESLLLKLKTSQDQQAWCRFVELYTPLLYHWARRLGLQSPDAADLAQDVLMLVFQKLPAFEYDRNKSFRSWLRTVTLNKYRQWCRKKSLGAIDVTQSAWRNVAQPSSLAESTWDLDYQGSLVARAMELLAPEFQPNTWRALREYALSGRTAKEVADELGVSVWTIYSSKSRLMVRLREELDGQLD